MVVPWEYVRTKCTWIKDGNQEMLVPLKYEPWMGIHKEGTLKGEYMVKLREEWLESEEGKTWLAKKEEQLEKKKKFKTIKNSGKKREEKKEPAEVA